MFQFGSGSNCLWSCQGFSWSVPYKIWFFLVQHLCYLHSSDPDFYVMLSIYYLIVGYTTGKVCTLFDRNLVVFVLLNMLKGQNVIISFSGSFWLLLF